VKGLVEGVRDFRSQWLRYLLTGLSMLIGVLGVVAVAIIGSVGGDMLIAQQEQVNGREASYSNAVEVPPISLDQRVSESRSLDAFYQGLSARMIPGQTAVMFQVQSTLTAVTSSQAARQHAGVSLPIRWIRGDISKLQRIPIVRGRLPAESVYPLALALNAAAVRALGVGPDDRTVELTAPAGGGRDVFALVGEVADGQSLPIAYASLPALQEIFPEQISQGVLEIRVKASAGDLDAVSRMLSEVAGQHGFTLQADTRRVDTVQSVRDQLAFFRSVFAACAILILVIAALGAANVGISAVAERSRELVVRRAIGARRRDVFAQVLWSSLAVGVLVALIAVAATVAFLYVLVPRWIPASSSIVAPAFPWAACLSGIAAALVTSALGGALPALKATRLPVALALRD
jgi:hypothetical protein